MASLHAALRSLGPIAFECIPSNPKERRSAARDLLADACLIVESVPTQQPLPICLSNGENSCNGYNTTEVAGVGTITSSTQSADAAFPVSPQLSALRKEWGKPVNKLNNSKDNPLQIPVYKLNSKDGKGAWFARRSVHEGLPFEKWRAKLKGEFEETMKLRTEEGDQIQNLEKGKIRGLGCERRIEEVQIYDDDDDDDDDQASGLGDGDDDKEVCRQIGLFEVYHLSARFPGPASPRDFVALLLSSDVALDIGRLSADDDADDDMNNIEKSQGRHPRHFMVISRPCHHPDASPRQGYIRGEYESIEFIRELPLANNNGGLNGKEEVCPVEWIMITRSDPGGSVPRWMVERGTPPSIVGDAMKFMAWASREGLDEAEGSGMHLTTRSSDKSVKNDSNLNSDEDNGAHEDSDCDESGECRSQTGGIFGNVANRFSTGLEKYAPQAVLDYMPARPSSVASDASFHSLPRSISVPLSNDSENEQIQNTNANHENHNRPSISSMDTFASADSRTSSLKGVNDETDIASAPDQIPALLVSRPQSINASSSSSTGLTIGPPYPQETREHKKLVKLASRKREVEIKLASSRAALDSLKRDSGNRAVLLSPSVEDNNSDDHGSIRGTGTVISSNDKNKNKKEDKNDNDNSPMPATLRKRATTLTRDENKLKDQIRKIETEEQKVSIKIEAKRRKEAASEEKVKAKGEIDGLKSEIRRLKGLVADLRGERETWVELVEKLQKENKMLIAEKEEAEG
ncbi:hypothetical protein GX50_04747 [[Emmonsia] crescens]|uniref:DUF3074 domain-containing protein n=1 Tax=[Emmonsia] crescens TaxID=73230 RepID=A0A2B7ZI18_9EURO|nr:hypothetical protein GX50_04747 [Emmonsia crescens]